MKRVILEINEVEIDLLRAYSSRLKLKQIAHICNYTQYQVASSESREKDGLDPWCQWVTVHTGVDLKEHGIRELGEGESLGYKQLWEEISEEGRDVGVFGVMNAKGTKGLKYFCSDVWTTKGKTYPSWLANMVEVGVYASQSYLDLSISSIIKKGIRSGIAFLKQVSLRGTSKAIRYMCWTAFRYGINIHTMTSAFEYFCILGLVASREWKESEIDIVFLNLIAHLQHQFWNPERPHKYMEHGMVTLELILQEIKMDKRVEDLLVLNGLEQKNVYGQGYGIYRQKNPERFMQFLGLKRCRVEQKMTNECVYRAQDNNAAAEAYEILKKAEMDGEALFQVKWNSNREVFCRLADGIEIKQGSTIVAGDRSCNAGSLVSLVCERTGEHRPTSSILSRRKIEPAPVMTKDLYNVLMRFSKGSG